MSAHAKCGCGGMPRLLTRGFGDPDYQASCSCCLISTIRAASPQLAWAAWDLAMQPTTALTAAVKELSESRLSWKRDKEDTEGWRWLALFERGPVRWLFEVFPTVANPKETSWFTRWRDGPDLLKSGFLKYGPAESEEKAKAQAERWLIDWLGQGSGNDKIELLQAEGKR